MGDGEERRGLPSLQLTNSGRETAFIPSYKTLNRHCRHFLLPQLDRRRQLFPQKLVILIIPIQFISPPPLCTSPPRSASRLLFRSRGIPSSLGRNGPTPPRGSRSAAGAWNINSFSRISIKKRKSRRGGNRILITKQHFVGTFMRRSNKATHIKIAHSIPKN